jgi:hypothetical protein
MKILFALFVIFIFFFVGFVSSETPYTPQVITVRGFTVAPVNFFNSGEGQVYTASLERNSLAVRLETDSVYVQGNEFGSFSLIIGELELEKGVYFDKMIISNAYGVFQEVPIIIGFESRSAQIEYDVSIEFNPNSDISVISGETILSPKVNVYKLNFNNPSSNGVGLIFSIYSIDGELLFREEEVVSISRQASFEHFFNLGANPLNEVLIVVSARKGNSVGLDVAQVSISQGLFFSPLSGKDYSFRIYMSVFVFLISSLMLVSYLWYGRSVRQAMDWKSQINDIKKIKFSDIARSLRRLVLQKEVLKRAYVLRYISKNSYDSAMLEIDKLSDKLKKRL